MSAYVVRYFLSDEDKGGGKNLYTNNNPEDKTYAWNPNSNSTKRPSLDLYYQRSLPHKQTLILNMVVRTYDMNANQMYQEWKNDILLSDILSNVDGDNIPSSARESTNGNSRPVDWEED